MLPNDIATRRRDAAAERLQHVGIWQTPRNGRLGDQPLGTFARWPNFTGFDEFYGFLGGETNQWSPAVYHNLNRVETPDDPDYHFMNDMATQAIKWIRFQQSLTPDKPFFTYFAPGAVHAPHHVPEVVYQEATGPLR